ncbi:hypothetical protein BBP40_010424 [Aspergillus hancockii]|nr:hypothetical protein BBP40_010424 [Aspergillus hancockii]
MGPPSLPASEYDRYLGNWPLFGFSVASSEPVPAPQNPQLQYAEVSPTETCTFDIAKDLWCPSPYANVIDPTGYQAPLPLSGPESTVYAEQQHVGIGQPVAHDRRHSTGNLEIPQHLKKPKTRSVSPKSHTDISTVPLIRPKPMPKRRSSQDTPIPQRRRSISSDHKEDDPTICMMRKKAHNQVEKRYRANLNAGFKQLEDITKQEFAAGVADTKMAKGLRPGRKALILQHAYEYIIGLQTELHSMQMRLGER